MGNLIHIDLNHFITNFESQLLEKITLCNKIVRIGFSFAFYCFKMLFNYKFKSCFYWKKLFLM